jgi:hypothetical protein
MPRKKYVGMTKGNISSKLLETVAESEMIQM